MAKAEGTSRIYLLALAGWGVVLPIIWIVREWAGCVNGIAQVSGTPPEWDFTSFWEAGRLASAGQFATIANFTLYRAELMASLHYDIGQSAFIYAPVSYLLFAPLGVLSLPVAYGLWVAGGIAGLLFALRVAGLSWLFCGLVLASPACLYNLLLGQNGAFTAAMLVLAVALTARRPALAGFAGAGLVLKPQLGLLLPFMWAARQSFVAIASAVAAGLALIGLSILIFGVAPWEDYATLIMPALHHVMMAPFPQPYQVNSIAVVTFLQALGVAAVPALWLQGLVSLAAAVAAMIVWRRLLAFEVQFAMTIMLSLLALPYGYVYDMVAYAAALGVVAQARGVSWQLAFFWLWPAIARNVTMDFGLPVTPLVVLAAIIWLARLPARPA